MARISKKLEIQKQELKPQLREARYADLHMYVVAENLETSEFNYLEKTGNLVLEEHTGTPVCQFCYTGSMSRLLFRCDACRVACA